MFKAVNLINVKVMIKGCKMFLVQIENNDYRNSKGIEIKSDVITEQQFKDFISSIIVDEVMSINFPVNDIIVRNLTTSETIEITKALNNIKNNLKALITT